MIRPHAVLFDLDDTLVDAHSGRANAWREVVGAFSDRFRQPDIIETLLDVLETVTADFWSDPDRHRKGRLNLPWARRHMVATAFAKTDIDDAALGEEIAAAFESYRARMNRLFPDAHETLDRFRGEGVKLAVVTNGMTEVQREKLERFDLVRRFDHIQIEGEAGIGKPEPEAYTRALNALGAAAETTWMVGDNLDWDVAAPQRHGITGIWYDPAGAGLADGHPVRPDRIIRRLSELHGPR